MKELGNHIRSGLGKRSVGTTTGAGENPVEQVA